MSGGWKGSTRKETLPADWDARRERRFRLDGYRCTFTDERGRRCPERATDCDHVGDRLDHSLSNLTSLCSEHHDLKSSQQGVAARAWLRASARRPPEVDPKTVR